MLSDAFLSKLDALALRMRRPAAGGAGGLRRSKALGSSAEFSDYREYAAGDDVRRIDWNAYARFERLFLKLFMEEREQHVQLILDASASMGAEKWEPAVQLIETLGYLALCGGDRTTVYTVSDGQCRRTHALQGRQSYPELAAFVEGTRPAGRTSLYEGISRMELPAGRGATVLVSDLLDEAGYQRALQSLVYRKQETSVVQVFGKADWEPQIEDVTELTDSETDAKLIVSANYETLRRYRETARAYVEEIGAFCRKYGMTHVFILPRTPFERQMLRELTRSGLVG